jgi:hypothetical protein
MYNFTQTSYDRLAEIAKATLSGGSCYSSNDNVLSDLVSNSFVITNAQLVQRDEVSGTVVAIAARATDLGVSVYRQGFQSNVKVTDAWGNATTPDGAPDATGSTEKPAFVIESYEDIPEVSRRRQSNGLRPREELFPWSTVQPGQRFFIPETLVQSGKSAGQPTRHYSVTASANERMRERGIAKHFVVVAVRAGDVMLKGTPREQIVVANGEYVYCREGFAPAAKPRKSKVTSPDS